MEEVVTETPIELKTYPNPFNNQINIMLSAPSVEKYEIEINTLLGQTVLSVTNLATSSYILNTQALPQGIYLLYIKSEGKNLAAGKIVKQ
jgi:hypothetical protein